MAKAPKPRAMKKNIEGHMRHRGQVTHNICSRGGVGANVASMSVC